MKSINSRYGQLIVDENADLIGQSVLKYGEWAQNEIWLIEKLVKQGDVVIDVGAYIGTHTLALAEFVGKAGFVHSFEPQEKQMATLKSCIDINSLTNVELHSYALGQAQAEVNLRSATLDSDNAGSFSLFNANFDKDSPKTVKIRTLDSFELQRCDFLKIDVEGMEFAVLEGARHTIAKSRPLMVCECNFLENGAPLLTWSIKNQYVMHGVVLKAFNPLNFGRNTENIFGEACEVSLILIPKEKNDAYGHTLSTYLASEVKTLDALALVLFKKPQYIIEAYQSLGQKPTTVADNERALISASADAANLLGANSKEELECSTRRIRIVVPFYKNPQLVRPLFLSLLECAAELRSTNAGVYFYNDSPGDIDLKLELDRCVRDKGDINLTIFENESNLGFVGTMNLAFAGAVESGDDVVLLNSDTRVFSGAIREICEVAYSDSMIGFVSPRSNNATLCTLPHGDDQFTFPAEKSFKRFAEVSKFFPRITYVPTAVGFCLYVKSTLLKELGGFDPKYGRGYNEENDLIMRANRLGYRAVLANHAFVWHQGEQSFGSLDTTKAVREQANAKVLNARYPEYPNLVRGYLESPDYRAEKVFSAMLKSDDNSTRIGFDFSSFGTYHNGTFEAGKQLLLAANRSWPKDIEIFVFMSRQSWDFHELEGKSRAKWIDTHQPDAFVAAIVRIGQPFDSSSISRMMGRSPVLAFFMLDTISADCGYLKTEFDESLWHFTMRWADVVFTNSKFTADQFLKRYILGERTKLVPSLHSVTPSQYLTANKAKLEEAASSAEFALETKGVLIIGNKFEHKALITTVKALAKNLPSLSITALGCSGIDAPNVRCLEAGDLSDSELDALYDGAQALVFPSHYEGFGFPILHALVRRKPIYLRKLPVFEEIVGQISSGAQNVIWYESTQQLSQMLSGGVRAWDGAEATGEVDGWARSAYQVLDALEEKIASANTSYVADRMRWFELAFSHGFEFASDNQSEAERASRFVSRLLDRKIGRVLANPLAYAISRTVWKAYRRVR
jgi:FkbM family methyltransferase